MPSPTSSTTDAVVVGAGVIGCSVALELARGGRAVTVVDRGPGAGQGSTSASSAVVRFNYSTRTGVAAAWEAKHLWARWQEHLGCVDEAGMASFHQTGSLCLDSPEQDRSRVLELFDQVGVPYEEWDAGTIRRRLPQLDPGRHYPPKAVTDESFWDDADGELTGYWNPDSGYVDDPALAAHNLMAAARRHGATFRFGCAVTAVRREANRVRGVELASGERMGAPVVVNVSGPHSGEINELAGVLDDFSVSTRPMRQEVHEVPAPDGHGVPQPVVLDLDLGTYSRGTPSGQLLVGGAEPACDPLQWLEDPDEAAPTVSRQLYEAQVYRAARRMPELHVPNTPRGVVGVYDVADDWIPIYDRTGLPGFYVAIGTSGNQFKNAPVVGRFMAEIISSCEAGHDHDADPVQVRLPLTGQVANLGSYSRLRPVNPDSSFSVMG